MSGSTVCALEFRSGRRFTFSNVAAANGLTFGAPADCECQKKLDISLRAAAVFRGSTALLTSFVSA